MSTGRAFTVAIVSARGGIARINLFMRRDTFACTACAFHGTAADLIESLAFVCCPWILVYIRSGVRTAQYRLLAVIVHTGQSGQAGHYVAFVRRVFSASTLSSSPPASSPYETAGTPERPQQSAGGFPAAVTPSATPPAMSSAHGFWRARKSIETWKGPARSALPSRACGRTASTNEGDDKGSPASHSKSRQPAVTNAGAKMPSEKWGIAAPSTSHAALARHSSHGGDSTVFSDDRALSAISSTCRCKFCAEAAEVSTGPGAKSTSVSANGSKPAFDPRRYSSLLMTEAKAAEPLTQVGSISSSPWRWTACSSDRRPNASLSGGSGSGSLCFLRRSSSSRKSLADGEADAVPSKSCDCQCSFCINRRHPRSGQPLYNPHESCRPPYSCLRGSAGKSSEGAGDFCFLSRTASRRCPENLGECAGSGASGFPFRCNCSVCAVSGNGGGISHLEEGGVHALITRCPNKLNNACQTDGPDREPSRSVPGAEKDKECTCRQEERSAESNQMYLRCSYESAEEDDDDAHVSMVMAVRVKYGWSYSWPGVAEEGYFRCHS